MLVLVAGSGAAWALLVGPASDRPSPDAAPPRTLGVRYLASGELDGTTIVLREEVVFDDGTTGSIAILVGEGEKPDPEDWSVGAAVGGVPTLVRTRTIHVSDATLISSTFAVRLSLGEFPVPDGSATLVARDGSQVVLTGPRVRSARPARQRGPPGKAATAPRRPRSRLVPASRISRSPCWLSRLRSPTGHWFYGAVTWGPLPWLIGGLVALVGSVLWDRILRLVGLADRRPAPRTKTDGVGN